jgi:hypothetical protein
MLSHINPNRNLNPKSELKTTSPFHPKSYEEHDEPEHIIIITVKSQAGLLHYPFGIVFLKVHPKHPFQENGKRAPDLNVT